MGYYWSTVDVDVVFFAGICQVCQDNSNRIDALAVERYNCLYLGNYIYGPLI